MHAIPCGVACLFGKIGAGYLWNGHMLRGRRHTVCAPPIQQSKPLLPLKYNIYITIIAFLC